MSLKGLTPGISLASFPSPIPPDNGGSLIKSVQHIDGSWSDTNTTKDYPISPVDPNKTVVLFAATAAASNPQFSNMAVTLVNATTVRVTRFAGALNAGTLGIQVIELVSVKSKQTGNFSLTSFPQNVPISAINPNKTLIFATAISNLTINDVRNVQFTYVITSSTNVKFYSEATGFTIYWQVIELP